MVLDMVSKAPYMILDMVSKNQQNILKLLNNLFLIEEYNRNVKEWRTFAFRLECFLEPLRVPFFAMRIAEKEARNEKLCFSTYTVV